MDKDMREALAAALFNIVEGSVSEEKESGEISIEGQRERLQEVLSIYTPNMEKMKVGDFIVRNPIGKGLYKYPTEKQLMMITRKYDHTVPHKDEGHCCHNAEVAMVWKDRVRFSNVDLRFYTLNKEYNAPRVKAKPKLED